MVKNKLVKIWYNAVISGERNIEQVSIFARPAVEDMLAGKDPETITPEEWDKRIEELREIRYV